MHYLRPWSDVALLSRACVLRVFQRCWRTSRDFTDMPQSDTDNIHLAAEATALTSMYSVTVSYRNRSFTLLKKLPNYVNIADRISASSTLSLSLSLFSWQLEPRQPGRTFSRQYANFKSEELKMIKDSTQSFAGFQSKREKDSSSADKASQDQSHSAATPCLHVDINLKESRL